MNSETAYPYEDSDRAEVLPFVPRTVSTLLDVGCSFGGFGMGLKRSRPDIEVWGIEPNRDAATVAASRLDSVVNGTFPEDAPNREFDCLVFNDVLEHLEDPWSVLREARRFLGPRGSVVASIPNVRHFSVLVPLVLQGSWTYRDVGILDRTHLRFFTRSTMIDLFEASGWRVDRIAPSRISHATHGRIPRLLAMMGRRADEFRTLNYVVVAAPADPTEVSRSVTDQAIPQGRPSP